MKLCIRKSDGTVWKPSTPPGYTYGHAIADCMLGRTGFYFKQVVLGNRGWWIFTRRRWVETGEIWEPKSGEFTVVEARLLEGGES